MENSIIRGAIQGLIDDSKTIDRICNKLGCERSKILDIIDDNFAFESEPVATTEEIKEVIDSVRRVDKYIVEARYSAEEAKDQTDTAISECDSASDYINDAVHMVNKWESRLKEEKAEAEERNAEADQMEMDSESNAYNKKAPAKKLMNNFQAHNQQ